MAHHALASSLSNYVLIFSCEYINTTVTLTIYKWFIHKIDSIIHELHTDNDTY